MERKIPVICVSGPTASGKTALAVKLAKKYSGEVISADSMQIYEGMDIATAKPDAEEMGGILIREGKRRSLRAVRGCMWIHCSIILHFPRAAQTSF